MADKLANFKIRSERVPVGVAWFSGVHVGSSALGSITAISRIRILAILSFRRA